MPIMYDINAHGQAMVQYVPPVLRHWYRNYIGCTTRPAEATPNISGAIKIYLRPILPRQNGTHHGR